VKELQLPDIADTDAHERLFRDDLWREAAANICARHGLGFTELRRVPQGENVVFLVGETSVIKIYRPLRDCFRRERAALECVAGKLEVKTPEILHSGEIEGWPYLAQTQLKGRLASEVWPHVDAAGRLRIAAQLGALMRGLHALAARLETPLNRNWAGFVAQQAATTLARQSACGGNPEWLESLPDFLAARLGLLSQDAPQVLLHGDIHNGNLLLREGPDGWRVSGLFDFGDALRGFREYEFVAPGVLMFQGQGAAQREMLRAYGYAETQLDENLWVRLMLLTVLYECSDLRKYATRLAPAAVNLSLAELERAIWTFVEEEKR
jgi:hygromycin-B 7''-O-kinase